MSTSVLLTSFATNIKLGETTFVVYHGDDGYLYVEDSLSRDLELLVSSDDDESDTIIVGGQKIRIRVVVPEEGE